MFSIFETFIVEEFKRKCCSCDLQSFFVYELNPVSKPNEVFSNFLESACICHIIPKFTGSVLWLKYISSLSWKEETSYTGTYWYILRMHCPYQWWNKTHFFKSPLVSCNATIWFYSPQRSLHRQPAGQRRECRWPACHRRRVQTKLWRSSPYEASSPRPLSAMPKLRWYTASQHL